MKLRYSAITLAAALLAPGAIVAVASADEPLSNDASTATVAKEAVWALDCQDASTEIARRRRTGDLVLPRDRGRDVDVDTVEIDHQWVDDTVALDDERPTLDVMGGPESVTAGALQDLQLFSLVQLCQGRQR